MATKTERASTYTAGSGDADARNGEPKRNLWTSMLESVASGKRLPEKNLLILGGGTDAQRGFLEALSADQDGRNSGRQKMPPVANNFALGYTYYDVLDADQDDILARVSLYLLSQPSGEFASLVSPLLTPETIPNTALVILLDWAQPHLWLRQIWSWIQVLEEVMGHTSPEARSEMEDTMSSWRERGRGGSSTNLDGTPSATAVDSDGSLPLGPGEWTEPLGLPLCVVCQNAQKIDFLERNQGWKEPDFDTVLQFLRTVLLRHGGSLIYTSQNIPSQLPSLIHSTLGITSLLKRQPLKHNVIDRDKIVVPPNWDSWGKIRVLGGSFDTEVASKGWAEDIKLPLGSILQSLEALEQARAEASETGKYVQEDSAIARYEDWCRDPNSGGMAVVESAMGGGAAVGVDSEDTQEFLERQLKILEAFKAKAPDKTPDNNISTISRRADFNDEKTISEHIGPVQFNMGGIQVDADDMLQRLKDRNANNASDDEEAAEEETAPAPNITKEYDNEQLHDFFSGLMNRTGGAAESPR
ncbi:dynein light intermediate chain [Cordyceps javanica]|uniref:Dynein light intermediate chain n=1 Tax=Cordyceps javanica TaxID=43265 RepID=A0A545W4B7_9HYPO|nr:dynein light intermediate chain [Cordyceps javanica]TQW08843.1 dynein light intermediate chain [Cordyceps javanica]